jgi:hypothetical protein
VVLVVVLQIFHQEQEMWVEMVVLVVGALLMAPIQDWQVVQVIPQTLHPLKVMTVVLVPLVALLLVVVVVAVLHKQAVRELLV